MTNIETVTVELRHPLLPKLERFVEHVFNTPDAQWNRHMLINHNFGAFWFETPGNFEVIDGNSLNYWDSGHSNYDDDAYGSTIDELANKFEVRVFFDLNTWKKFDFTGRFSVWCDPVRLGPDKDKARSISFHYTAKFGEIRVLVSRRCPTRLTKKTVADFSDWLDDAAVTPIRFR